MATAAPCHPREHLRAPDASGLRTAFVLPGGASLGALQVGMLEALYEHDIVPDMLVGSSAGALNAAFVASRAQTTATAKALGRVWRNLQREDIFPVSMSALVLGLCGRREHLVPDRGLRQLAWRYIEFADLADAPIPLHLVVFDLVEGRELSLPEGRAADSVVAASSIPCVFPPVAIGDRRLIDGGVVNNTAISHAVELGAERIYVLPTQDPSDRQLDRAPKSALDAAICGVRLLVVSRLEPDIVRYSPEAELIVLPAPNAAGMQPTNFEYSTQLIVDARVAARRPLTRQDVGRQVRIAKR